MLLQVNVDFQNNVTLNGSANFIIQVDGRQRDREFLAKLLPSDIQTIEIISNPSGKYEGNIDGVINIILKKEARYGMSGNASLSLKPFNKPTTTVTGSLDYAMGKITFYVTALSVQQKLFIGNTGESSFEMNDSTTSMSGDGGINVKMSSINSGFDYYINEKNNLSLNVSYKPIGQDIDMLGETFLYKNNVPLNTISSLTTNGLRSHETSVSLFYNKFFRKPIQEFTTEVSYYWFNSDENNDFTNTRYLYNDNTPLSTYSRLEDNLNDRNYFSTKLNYVQPIGMNAKFEGGYQFYYQDLSYDFNIDNDAAENLFLYNELRNSVYAGFTFNLKKVGMQANLRVENSHISADSVTHPNYSCFLPSVNLQSVDYFSYSITSYAFAQLDKKKTATVFVFLNYNGVNMNAQSKTYSLPMYGLGIQKQLKNHNLGVFYLMPFSHKVNLNRTYTETPYFNSSNIISFDISNYIQFTYSYKFNKGKNVRKIGRKVEVESDSKSQAIGT